MKSLKPIPRNTENLRQEYDTLIQHLGTEDNWYAFHRLAKDFIKAYDALSPDPEILKYRDDLKWVAGFLPLGTLTFEKRESTLPRDVSAKIREMLDEHLSVTGITTLCKLHDITDPIFGKILIAIAKTQKSKSRQSAKAPNSAKSWSKKKRKIPFSTGHFLTKF
jgi:type I restriction enzyme R subunit